MKKQRNPIPRLTPEGERRWAKAFDEAKKRGDPVAALAESLAKKVQMKNVVQEYMPDHLINEDVALHMNVDLGEDVEFFVDDAGRTRRVAMQEEPDGKIHRRKVEVDRQLCPVCKSKDTKQGFILEELVGEPNLVTQCGNCGNFLWSTVLL